MGFTDQEWEEISQDIPKENEPFLQKYLESREALIAQENKQRSGECHISRVEYQKTFTLTKSRNSRCLIPPKPLPTCSPRLRHRPAHPRRGE